MTLLITGAAGHVGRELVRQAAAQGLAVIALHRGTAPPDGQAPGVTWHHLDLDDATAVAAFAAATPIDACIHAAAISNEVYARPNPPAAFATNCGATVALLDAAKAHGWRRFLLVSTGSVFQRRADLVTPILEDEPPQPGNVYGTTKVVAEQMVEMYRREFALSAAAIRISWVYGPPVVSLSPARGPIPSFALRALRGEAIQESGGDFAASFTHVSDVAAGLLAAVAAETLRHGMYHLGHGVNFPAAAVAAAVRAACPGAVLDLGPGTEPWTRYTALRAPLAGNRLAADTGFTPSVSLAVGVGAYVEWLRQHQDLWPAKDES